MATFSDAQVAAYIRDNNLDAGGISKAAGVFGLNQDQIGRAQGLLSSGSAAVNDASNAYKAAVTTSPALDQQNRDFYSAQTGTGWATTNPTYGSAAPSYSAGDSGTSYAWTPTGLSSSMSTKDQQSAITNQFASQYNLNAAELSKPNYYDPFLQSTQWTQMKPEMDAYQHALTQAGRSDPVAGASYSSQAVYNPKGNMGRGSIDVMGPNGVLLTSVSMGESGYSTLDRLGVDPASYSAAVKTALSSPEYYGSNLAAADKQRYQVQSDAYRPRVSAAADASYLVSGLNPTQDASAFFSASSRPSLAEFIKATGLSERDASGLLYSSPIGGGPASALVDWNKVMASPNPAQALIAAHSAIASNPQYAAISSQALRSDYQGWTVDGRPVTGGAAGAQANGYAGGSLAALAANGSPLGGGNSPGTAGSVGGFGTTASAGVGGFGANGLPSTGINLNQLQGTTQWDVQPNQTVQAQLQQIIASDSPLMQQARTRALQTANGRGLLNSTMSQSAADAAMYEAAYPMAAADAGLYGEAARFNSDASNTFSRDSNAFTRDAFMADFNLAANEWAKQQDQVRTLSTMDYESRLTLDRDAIQNGYQSARDAIQNGYAINADTRKFNWQSKENALTRDTEGKVTQSQQVELDTAKQNAARKAIVDANQDLTSRLLGIEKEPNLSTESKDTMIDRAVDGYQTIVQAHIAESGWTFDAWDYTPTARPPVAAPAASTALTGSGSDGS